MIRRSRLKSIGDLLIRTLLIVGAAPGGLGAEAARVIAKYGANLVVLAGRNVNKFVPFTLVSSC